MIGPDTTAGGRIVSKSGGTGQRGWDLRVEGGKARFQVPSTLSKTNEVISPTIPTDAWVHVAGVFTAGESIAVFVNGVESAKETLTIATMPSSAQPVQIGKRPSTPDTYVGLLDDVRVYSRALSVAEIAELAK
jgi:hypothetical protein